MIKEIFDEINSIKFLSKMLNYDFIFSLKFSLCNKNFLKIKI